MLFLVAITYVNRLARCICRSFCSLHLSDDGPDRDERARCRELQVFLGVGRRHSFFFALGSWCQFLTLYSFIVACGMTRHDPSAGGMTGMTTKPAPPNLRRSIRSSSKLKHSIRARIDLHPIGIRILQGLHLRHAVSCVRL